MHYAALATDYDGTIAHDGVVDPPTIAALERLRASGRRLVLVTGRELPDLVRVMPRLDLFDRVVAENGALLYRPESRDERPLAEPPPPALVERLRAAGVAPLSVGRVIVATWEPNETKVLAAIHALGLEWQITFNKGAVMVLPAGITKESGLRAALAELEIGPLNCAGVGDAENDLAMLDLCGAKVAVANALPSVRETADLVTQGARGKGVAELVERLLATDLAEIDRASVRRQVSLAETEDGNETLRVAAHRETMLLTGASGGGKTTLTVGLLERVADAGFQFCVVDPEGDYDGMGQAVTEGTQTQPPVVEHAIELMRKTGANVTVNLLGLKLRDRPDFLASLLPELLRLRARTGRPDFVVIDEAHHLLPQEADPAGTVLPPDLQGVLFVTVHPQSVAPRVLGAVGRVLAVGTEPGAALDAFCRAAGLPEPRVAGELETGEVETGLLLTLSRDDPAPRRLRVIPGAALHRRHVRKYAEGTLPEDRSFFFHGPDGRLNLRATNLDTFLQLGDGIDETSWEFHRRRGDYSRWVGLAIKDADLAREISAVERDASPPAEARAALREAIERRYTLPA